VPPATTVVEFQLDIARYEVIDAPHSDTAAARGVQLIHEGKGELLMKGSLHMDELMREVTSAKNGLRTSRRISHVFFMDVPTHIDTLFITDAPDDALRHAYLRKRWQGLRFELGDKGEGWLSERSQWLSGKVE
jgi:hypothetical protein